MKVNLGLLIFGGFFVAFLTVAMLFTAGWDRPPIETVQTNFRGLGSEQVYNPRDVVKEIPLNTPSEEPWPLEPPEGPTAGEIYENVQVLGHLSDDHFNRLMAGITEWVSPEQGCAYCHNEENYAEDNLYTKIVARRMIQMTQTINSEWGDHVAGAGVNCNTCHRGQNVPQQIWFTDPSTVAMNPGFLGNRAGQNVAGAAVGQASLPTDPFTPFLVEDHQIAVNGPTALPTGNRQSIKQTEWTYGLMMHMASSLGVNCTYCHNTRAFGEWSQSPPQRTTAWYGIRMLRELNNDYLIPLGIEYPPYRLGELGDAPKANCATCHIGAYKPFFGADVISDWPSLSGPGASYTGETADAPGGEKPANDDLPPVDQPVKAAGLQN